MAQTLKFGSGTWATKKGSTLAYNDEDGNFKPLPFTYTGFGKGTRVNKEGLIEVVENDRPRIDYTDSEDGVFLLEKASTNSQTNSEDLTVASSYPLGAVSISSNQIISPDGTLNADKLVELNTNARHELYSKSLSFSGTTSVSFFAKADERKYISVFIGGNPALGGATFDVQDGLITLSSGGTNANIVNYGNGWYKCSFTSTFSGTNNVYYCLRDNGNAVDVQTYQGDGTSGMYLWGFQTEIGQSYPSSYIPTQGNPQTRVQETASGSGNSEVFNSEQGVLFANIADFGSGINVISLNTGNNTQKIMLYLLDGNKIRYYIQGSGGFFSSDIAVTSTNNFSKILIKYKQNDFSLWVNGFEVDVNTSSITFDNLSSIDFYNPYSGGVDNFYGKTKEIGYYNEVLTDLELETLTSYRTWEEMVKELNLNIIHNE